MEGARCRRRRERRTKGAGSVRVGRTKGRGRSTASLLSGWLVGKVVRPRSNATPLEADHCACLLSHGEARGLDRVAFSAQERRRPNRTIQSLSLQDKSDGMQQQLACKKLPRQPLKVRQKTSRATKGEGWRSVHQSASTLCSLSRSERDRPWLSTHPPAARPVPLDSSRRRDLSGAVIGSYGDRLAKGREVRRVGAKVAGLLRPPAAASPCRPPSC